jgi:hypothetical protein
VIELAAGWLGRSWAESGCGLKARLVAHEKGKGVSYLTHSYFLFNSNLNPIQI